MAAHRRLLISARRDSDRRVLADRQIAEGNVDPGSGRRALSRERMIRRAIWVQAITDGGVEAPSSALRLQWLSTRWNCAIRRIAWRFLSRLKKVLMVTVRLPLISRTSAQRRRQP